MRNVLSNQELTQTVRTRVLQLVRRRRNGSWQGTMTDLLEAITPTTTPDVWVSSPSTLRRVVNRLVRAIRREGVQTAFSRTTDSNRTRLVSFTRVR